MKKSSLIAKITQDLSVSIIPFSLRKLHFATPSDKLFDKTVFRSDRTRCNDGFCTLVYLSTLSQTKPREQCPDVQGVTPLECPSSIIPTTNISRWTSVEKSSSNHTNRPPICQSTVSGFKNLNQKKHLVFIF